MHEATLRVSRLLRHDQRLPFEYQRKGGRKVLQGGSHASAPLRAKDSTKNPQRIPQRGGSRRPPPFVEAAAGRLPLWMGLAGAQASSSKQASGIKQQASSTKQQALRNWALRLWQEIKKSCFPDSQFLIRKFLL